MSERFHPETLNIHQYASLQPGPKLLVLGAVHGNETCGTQAIQRLQRELEQGELIIEQGSLTLVPVVNPMAYRLQRREGDRNLNRSMGITSEPKDYEDQIANVLCPLLQTQDALLDLHSFHTPGEPFALIGPANNQGDLQPFDKALEEGAMALNLGVNRFVEGWLETYAKGVAARQARGIPADIDYGVGTTETMRRYGKIAVTLECGQHEEATAPEVAYQAIRRTLSHLGLVTANFPEPNSEAEIIRLYDVVDRLHANDTLARDWQSFEKITKGEVLAQREDGTALVADRDGWIVFPNPDAEVNQEWYYLADASERLLR